MKAVISPGFLSIKDDLQEAVQKFNTTGESIYDGNRNSVRAFNTGEEKIVIKSFKKPGWPQQVIYRFFRASKARRSFLYAQKLLGYGIGTPTPVGFFENSSTFALKDSYYLSLYQRHNFTLRTLLTEKDTQEKAAILKSFAGFTKRLHDNNILFKDHTPGNTLISINDDHSCDFYLVDLNRMAFRALNYKERIKNFSKISVDKKILRILADSYAQLCGYNADDVFKIMSDEALRLDRRFTEKQKMKKKLRSFFKN